MPSKNLMKCLNSQEKSAEQTQQSSSVQIDNTMLCLNSCLGSNLLSLYSKTHENHLILLLIFLQIVDISYFFL